MSVWTRLGKKAFETLTEWGLKQLWAWLCISGVGLPTLLYGLSRVYVGLRTPWLISLWVILSAVLVSILLVFVTWYQWRQARRAVAALERRYQTYSWRGVEWPIRPAFAGLLHTSVIELQRGQASPTLLQSAIGDPVCSKCQSEVWLNAKDKKCAECGEPFDIGQPGEVALYDLKLEVYGKARARERREAKAASREFVWRRKRV